ncbi:hypothetical protein M2444_004627 [Paenibacillus sp. PastF-3]|nr:hypothetical protein [Paenibacillus sp. PastF-3]
MMFNFLKMTLTFRYITICNEWGIIHSIIDFLFNSKATYIFSVRQNSQTKISCDIQMRNLGVKLSLNRNIKNDVILSVL